MSFRLGEVKRYDPLAEELREALEPGDVAWLVVEFPDEASEIQAEVDRVLGPGWYLGRTRTGQEVEFGQEHVFGRRSPSMGAWWDHLPPFTRREKPKEEPRSEEKQKPRWWDYLPPRSYKKGGDQPETSRPSIFDIFRKAPPETGPIPPAERRERRAVELLPYTPPAEPPSAAMIPAPMAPPPLPRTPELTPIVSELTPISAEPDPFGMFEAPGQTPEAPKTSLPVLRPEQEIVAPGQDLFSMFEAPSSETGLTVREEQGIASVPTFEAPPEGSGGLVVRPEQGMQAGTIFDMFEAPPPETGLSIREEQGISTIPTFEAPPQAPPYVPPSATPEAAPPERKAETVKKVAERRARRSGLPTHAEWIAWLKETFTLPNLWAAIRDERDSEYFVEKQVAEEWGETPIETWYDLEWDRVFQFFDISPSIYRPFLNEMDKEEEQTGDHMESFSDMEERLLEPIGEGVSSAFDALKPDDIPGSLALGTDDDSGTWGLLYVEKFDPRRASRRLKEALEARERQERETRERDRKRKSEIKRIWGAMPEPEDLVSWIEQKYDLDAMFRDIAKERRLKRWKNELSEYGRASLPLEVVTDLGPKRAKDMEYDVAAYFGIPPEIVSLYEESDSSQELWNEIFWPFFQSLSGAFSMLLPYADLPGMIKVDEDDEDQLVLEYVEEEEES